MAFTVIIDQLFIFIHQIIIILKNKFLPPEKIQRAVTYS